MNQPEAANLLSVTVRTLNSWAGEDPPIPFKRVSQTEVIYEAPEIVRWFAAREVRKAIRTSSNWREEKDVAESREAVAKAELREIELARVKGDLLPVADVEREWTGHVLMVRQALLNVPHQVAVAFEDGLAYAEKKLKLQSMIDGLLRNLAGVESLPAPRAEPASPKRKSPVPRMKPRASRLVKKAK